MPTVENVEKKIAKVETFNVTIRRELDGSNVRGDRENMPTFKRQRAMKGSSTVAHWRRVRFDSMFPGFAVDVLYAGRHHRRRQHPADDRARHLLRRRLTHCSRRHPPHSPRSVLVGERVVIVEVGKQPAPGLRC